MVKDAAPPASAPPDRVTVVLKVVVCAAVVWLMWDLLGMVRLVIRRPPPEPYASQAFQRQQTRAPEDPQSSLRFPWPKYPGARETGRSAVVLNGVPLVDQTLEARARPERILAYYRRVMRGRGWRDNTEEFFKVDLHAIGAGGAFRNLQDENFLRRYDRIVRSKLSLVRRDRSILIEVKPGNKGRSTVDLHFAGTHSLLDMITQMAEKAGDRRGAPVPYLETRGAPGGMPTSARVYYSERPYGEHFEQMVRMLGQEGWSQVALPRGLKPPPGPGRQGLFARDEDVAVLAVGPDGKQGSAAIVTQSSPNL